jgi:ABC-type glycerol-3-phosphate transport system permease component
MGLIDQRKYGRFIGNLPGAMLRVTVLVIAATLSLFPLIWMLLTSIKQRVDAFAIPPVLIFTPTLEAYQTTIGSERFLLMMRNSVLITLMATLLTIGIASIAAYPVVFQPIRGKSALLGGILSTRMLPPVVLVIPVFFLMRGLGLLDSIIGLTLMDSALNLPFALILIVGFFRDIPMELVESAKLDGAGDSATFLRIVMPLAAPGLVVAAVLVAIFTWNDFLFALILSSRKAVTLPIYAAGLITEEGIYWSQVAATGTLMLLPLIAFFFLLQRRLVKGLLSGALKG